MIYFPMNTESENWISQLPLNLTDHHIQIHTHKNFNHFLTIDAFWFCNSVWTTRL